MWTHGLYFHQAAPTAQQLESHDVALEIRQQPKEALVTVDGKEKSRKPVDPPPIVQLRVSQTSDPAQHFLQSPYLFMVCSLMKNGKQSDENDNTALAGSLVSSLHRLKDVDNRDGGFFVFGDVSVKVQGTHRLVFSLFDLRKDTMEISFLKSIVSDAFRVVHPKDFRGLDESTYLSRAFSDQGVRLRLRKEPRAMMGSNSKRGYPYAAPSADPSVPSTPLAQQAQPSLYPSQDDLEHSAKRLRQYSDQHTGNTSPEAVDPSRSWPNYQGRPSSAGYPAYPATTLPQRQSSYGGYGSFTDQSTSQWPQTTMAASSFSVPRSDFAFRSPQQTNPYGMQSLPAVTATQAFNQRYTTSQFPGTDLSASYSQRDTDPSHADLTTDPNLPTYRHPYQQVTTPTSDSGDTRQAANTLSALQTSQQLHDQVASSQLSPPQESFIQRSYPSQGQLPAFSGAAPTATVTGYRAAEPHDSHPAAHNYLTEHAALPGTEG